MQLNNPINSSRTKIKVLSALSLGYLALSLVLTSVADAAPIAPTSTKQALTATPVTGDETSSTAKMGYADKVYWPMMPGDSLEQLANTLYPDSPILKERFIKKTLSFSRALGDDVQPTEVFTSSRLLIIPNEKAVKELTHRIRKSEEIQQEGEALRMSYRLKASPVVAAALSPASQQASKPVPAVTPVKPLLPDTRSEATNIKVETPRRTVAAANDLHTTEPVAVISSLPASSQSALSAPVLAQPPKPVVSSSVPAAPAPLSSGAFWEHWEFPIIRMPKIQWPDWEWPTLNLHQVSMPSVEWPFVELPSMEMPTLAMPNITLPEIAWRQHGQAAAQQLSAWYQHSMFSIQSAVQDARQRASMLMGDYQGKNATQVLQDYRLRNVALVGVLALVLLVLWGLHMQRTRQQKNMLSLIEDTITHHDAEFEIVIPAVASLEELSSGAETDVLLEAPHHPLLADEPDLTPVYEQKNYH